MCAEDIECCESVMRVSGEYMGWGGGGLIGWPHRIGRCELLDREGDPSETAEDGMDGWRHSGNLAAYMGCTRVGVGVGVQSPRGNV